MRCRHLMEKMRNLVLQSQCFNQIFSTKSKKEDKTYVFLIEESTLWSNVWSSELFCILKWWLYLYCIFLFRFLTYEVSYSNNIKNFRRNVGFIFAIGFQTIFCGTYFLRLTYPKLYFQGQIFAISGQNHKNKFCNNLWLQKFLPLR